MQCRTGLSVDRLLSYRREEKRFLPSVLARVRAPRVRRIACRCHCRREHAGYVEFYCFFVEKLLKRDWLSSSLDIFRQRYVGECLIIVLRTYVLILGWKNKQKNRNLTRRTRKTHPRCYFSIISFVCLFFFSNYGPEDPRGKLSRKKIFGSNDFRPFCPDAPSLRVKRALAPHFTQLFRFLSL